MVSGVRWTNVAISQQPVNQHVGGIKTIPFGVLAKSWSAAGGFHVAEALEACYATDAARKTGGAAFGAQSLDTGAPHSYFDFRNRLARDVKTGAAKVGSPASLVEYCAGKYSLSHDEAAEWVDRFLSDLKSGLSKLKRSK